MTGYKSAPGSSLGGLWGVKAFAGWSIRARSLCYFGEGPVLCCIGLNHKAIYLVRVGFWACLTPGLLAVASIIYAQSNAFYPSIG